MGLRILTGILQVQPGAERDGHATITFNPHGVAGDAIGVDLSEMGDTGDFNEPPGKIVSLRRVTVVEWDVGPVVEGDLFVIEDDPPNEAQMVVRWRTSGLGGLPSASQIHEISYMIVGEA
jgi:hypothetical protein